MKPKTMKAAIMERVGRITIEEMPVPEPSPGEVLIRIKKVGICGSDVHYFVYGKIGTHVVKPPFILGHEASGEVAGVGEGVLGLRPGDRITMEPGIPCGHCKACRTGHYNLCPDMKFWATPPVQGVLSEYAVHKADFCYRIPDTVSFEEASMAEPLSVGIYAAQRAGANPGKTVAILGAGPIGQLALQSFLAFGVGQTIVSDVVETRIELAKKLGAKVVVNAMKEDIKRVVAEHTNNEGVDIVVETAGSVETAKDSIYIARAGGTVLQIGNPPEIEISYPLLKVVDKELTILGNFRYANCYPTAIEALSNGKVDVRSLISHRFLFDETHEAFVFAHGHKSECMKVVIDVAK